MLEYVGLMHSQLHVPSKRDVLWFDRLGVVALEYHLPTLPPHIRADLTWLAERGVIFSTHVDIRAEVAGANSEELELALVDSMVSVCIELMIQRQDYSLAVLGNVEEELRTLNRSATYDVPRVITSVHDELRNILESGPTRLPQYLAARARSADVRGIERSLRTIAQHLRTVTNRDVTAVVTDVPVTSSSATGAEVASIVLSSFPEPDDSVPWEQVLDFRGDEDAQRCLRRLRRWTHKISEMGMSAREVHEELEFLLDEYNEHMRLHRMQTRSSVVETVLTMTAETIENLAKLRLSKLARSFFEIKRKRAALLAAERSAPGREVAYLQKVREAFHRGGA